MTLTIAFWGIMTLLVAGIALLPNVVISGAIIITSLIGIATLPIAFFMGLGWDPGIDFLNNIGAFKLLITGIISVIVMGVFFQGAVSSGLISTE